MNNLSKILLGAGLAVTLASCGAVQDPYGNNNGNNYPNNGNNYPNNGSNNGTVYRANDGQVYRRGEVYRDRNGNVYQNGRVVRTGDVYGRPGVLSRNGNQTVYYPNDNRRVNPNNRDNDRYGKNSRGYNKNDQYKFKKQKDRDDDDDDKDDDDDRRKRQYKEAKKQNNSNYYKKGKDRDDD